MYLLLSSICCCPLLAACHHSRTRRTGAGCALLYTTAPEGAQTGRVRQWAHILTHLSGMVSSLLSVFLHLFPPRLCSFSNSQRRQQWWVKPEAVSTHRSWELLTTAPWRHCAPTACWSSLHKTRRTDMKRWSAVRYTLTRSNKPEGVKRSQGYAETILKHRFTDVEQRKEHGGTVKDSRGCEVRSYGGTAGHCFRFHESCCTVSALAMQYGHTLFLTVAFTLRVIDASIFTRRVSKHDFFCFLALYCVRVAAVLQKCPCFITFSLAVIKTLTHSVFLCAVCAVFCCCSRM